MALRNHQALQLVSDHIRTESDELLCFYRSTVVTTWKLVHEGSLSGTIELLEELKMELRHISTHTRDRPPERYRHSRIINHTIARNFEKKLSRTLTEHEKAESSFLDNC